MEMGIREHRDRISRLAVALPALGIEEYVMLRNTHSSWNTER